MKKHELLVFKTVKATLRGLMFPRIQYVHYEPADYGHYVHDRRFLSAQQRPVGNQHLRQACTERSDKEESNVFTCS